MARQARRAANLVPGASLRGLVFDCCYDNRIPHTFGMLRHYNMPNRNRVLVSESPHLNEVGLAQALRIPESEVAARRYPAIGRGHRDFYGLHVMKGRIEDRVRRFSPKAISDGIVHHPATHELRDLPFSTVGWDMLQDTCPCEPEGVRQNWVTSNGSSRCHSCGGSLGKIDAVPVAEELKPALTLVAGVVDPDRSQQWSAIRMLPAEIQGADRTLLFNMIMNLAKASSLEVDNADPVKRTAALARACEALLTWPNGFDRIERSADCPTYLWDWVRRTYTMLDCAGQAVQPSTPSRTACSNSGNASPSYVASRSMGRINTNLISAMAAARLGGVDEQALKQAWDDGKLAQHIWVLGSSRVRAFDPAEVLLIAPKLRVIGSRTKAANFLGMPLYGLEQLLEAKLFAPASPTANVKQLQAHLDEAAALIARLHDNVGLLSGEAIPLTEAIRHVSGRPKPWAAVISALLSGALPYVIRSTSERGTIISQIAIAPQDIATVTAMRHDLPPLVEIERAKRWTGSDALECFNGNRGASQLLTGIEFVGTPSKRLLPVPLILERAAAGVTTSDLTRRSGLSTRQVAELLSTAGVKQIAPGLWRRVEAEQLVSLRRHETEGSRRPTG